MCALHTGTSLSNDVSMVSSKMPDTAKASGSLGSITLIQRFTLGGRRTFFGGLMVASLSLYSFSSSKRPTCDPAVTKRSTSTCGAKDVRTS